MGSRAGRLTHPHPTLPWPFSDQAPPPSFLAPPHLHTSTHPYTHRIPHTHLCLDFGAAIAAATNGSSVSEGAVAVRHAASSSSSRQTSSPQCVQKHSTPRCARESHTAKAQAGFEGR